MNSKKHDYFWKCSRIRWRQKISRIKIWFPLWYWWDFLVLRPSKVLLFEILLKILNWFYMNFNPDSVWVEHSHIWFENLIFWVVNSTHSIRKSFIFNKCHFPLWFTNNRISFIPDIEIRKNYAFSYRLIKKRIKNMYLIRVRKSWFDSIWLRSKKIRFVV